MHTELTKEVEKTPSISRSTESLNSKSQKLLDENSNSYNCNLPNTETPRTTQKKFPNRFTISLCVLITINLCLILASRLVLCNSTFAQIFASLFVPIIAFFGYEWSFIHSSGLTRKTHAFWDERNILQTYQPRARFEGHKFKPDPPTPGPGTPSLLEGNSTSTVQPTNLDEDELAAKTKREVFEASRNAHYANEFCEALKRQQGPIIRLENENTLENYSLESTNDSTMKPVPGMNVNFNVNSTSNSLSNDKKLNDKSIETAITPTLESSSRQLSEDKLSAKNSVTKIKKN